MAFHKKKKTTVVAMILLLSVFVGMQSSAAASGASPVADAGGPYIAEEGASILLDASGSTDPEGDSLMYRWNIDGMWIDNYYYPYMSWTWYEDFSGTITLEVSDGTSIDTDTANVTILNVPPQIYFVDGPCEIDVGAEFFLFVNFDQIPGSRSQMPSGDTHVATFFWGDETSTELSLDAGEFWANGTHVYETAGLYHIMITIVDSSGGEAVAGWEVMVGSLAPVDAGPDGVVDEGSEFCSSGFILDADSPTYSAVVDYYDGSPIESLVLNEGNTFDLSHTYSEDGVYTLMVTIFNEGMEYGSDTATVTVNNVAPVIESVSVSPHNPYRPGESFELNGVFSDPGVDDTHTVRIEWGDGSSTIYNPELTDTEIQGSHSYEEAGEYTLTVLVQDDDGGECDTSLSVIVDSPAFSIDDFKEAISDLKIPKGVKTHLISFIDKIPSLLEHHKTKAVIHQLEAFIKFVKAQNHKKLPHDLAKDLIQTTRVMIDLLRAR
jgi:PKD repeat protein